MKINNKIIIIQKFWKFEIQVGYCTYITLCLNKIYKMIYGQPKSNFKILSLFYKQNDLT